MDDEDLQQDDEIEERPRTRNAKFQCPKCGSYDTRRSNTEGWVVAFFQIMGRWPFRCRNCRGRFFRYAPPSTER